MDKITLTTGSDVVVSSAAVTANADIIVGFVTGTDKFAYVGTLVNDNGTNVNGIAGGEVGSSLSFGTDDILAVYTTDVANPGGASLNTQGTAFTNLLASNQSNLGANFTALITQLLAADGALYGVNNGLSSGESGLLVLDNNTGSVIIRVDSNGGAYDTTELTLVGITTDEVLAAGDFI